jgi:hypothetical protein
MKTALALCLAAGALALGMLAVSAPRADAQGSAERGSGVESGPAGGQRPSDGAPPSQRHPDAQAVEEEAPGATDEVPGVRQGCPDPRRKLELIV